MRAWAVSGDSMHTMDILIRFKHPIQGIMANKGKSSEANPSLALFLIRIKDKRYALTGRKNKRFRKTFLSYQTLSALPMM